MNFQTIKIKMGEDNDVTCRFCFEEIKDPDDAFFPCVCTDPTCSSCLKDAIVKLESERIPDLDA